jgi:hypothetical protein
MKTKSFRIFIVGPGRSMINPFWQICKTTSRNSLDSIYMRDQYEVLDSLGEEFSNDEELEENVRARGNKKARKLAQRYGSKRATII